MLNYSRLHLFGIEIFFNEFRGYLTFIETYIEESRQKFEAINNQDDIEQYKTSNPEYYNYLIDSYSERWFEIATYYPHNFRASFLVQTYTMIEYELRKICDHYHLKMKTDFRVNDLKGNSDLEKCKIFLKKACKINFTDIQAEWDFINIMRRLRNQIVHHQSKICQNDHNFQAILQLINANRDTISFKEDFDELNDEGYRYYDDKKHYEFTILLTDNRLNESFLNVAETFFKILLEDKLKYIS